MDGTSFTKEILLINMGSCKWKIFSQKKQEQTLIAIIIGLIHITGILTFELFEGDFNNDKIIDKLKKGNWSLSNKHTKIGF